MKKQPLIRWLPNMKKVLYALIPAMLASIYFFGWRSLILLIVVNLAGFLTEYIYLKFSYKEPVSSSVFVTSCLFALTLPPTIPFWMAVVGIVFGLLFGKLVFGGFGRNVFNPALVGRAFLYISFGGEMTSNWVNPVSGVGGSLGTWISDAITQATTLGIHHPSNEIVNLPSLMEKGQAIVDSVQLNIPSFIDMLFGNISGSLGETSAFLLLIGGIYLLLTKTADFRIVVSGFVGLIVMQAILWFANVQGAIDPLTAMLTGGWMLGIFFMATDPISAPSTKEVKWIIGFFIGIMTVLIRTFSIWPEGLMFAILLGNMFSPIVDYGIKELQKSKKNKKAKRSK